VVTPSHHSAAPHVLPAFITAPGETDVLFIFAGIMLLLGVLTFGNLFLRVHTLPERLAHKGQKLQFEIVAVLGLLALFTHVHLFWVAALLLALIDIPDFATPLRRMAGSLEKIAGGRQAEAARPADATDAASRLAQAGELHAGEPRAREPHAGEPHAREPRIPAEP
jgi:hypothetical protein